MARPPKLNDRVKVEGPNGSTREVLRRDAVLELVRQGCTHKVAALRAGISESTFYSWRDKGRKAKSGQYRAFVDDLEIAEAVAEGTLTLQMRAHCLQAGSAGVRATMFMLERRFPDTWKERKELDTTVSGPAGGPAVGLVVQIADLDTAGLAALSGVNLDDMDGLQLPTDDPPPTAQDTDHEDD